MHMNRNLLLAVAAAAPATAVNAQLVAGTDFDGNDVALVDTFDSRTTPASATPAGDAFGVRNRTDLQNGFGLPFNLSDDSVVAAGGFPAFPEDTAGVVGQAKTDNFFAENDADGVSPLPAFAVFSFDVGAPTQIDTLSIDIGAFGTGFEDDDVYRFIIDPDPTNGTTTDEITLLEFTGSDPDTSTDEYTYRPFDSGAVTTEARPLRLRSAFGTTNVAIGTAVDKSVAATGALDSFTVDISALGALSAFDLVFERNGASRVALRASSSTTSSSPSTTVAHRCPVTPTTTAS